MLAEITAHLSYKDFIRLSMTSDTLHNLLKDPVICRIRDQLRIQYSDNNEVELVAILADDVNKIKYCLENRNASAEKIFINSCNSGSHKIIKYLIQNNIVDPTYDNNRCLKLCFERGHVQLLQVLLESNKIDPVILTYCIKREFSMDNHEILSQLINHLPKSLTDSLSDTLTRFLLDRYALTEFTKECKDNVNDVVYKILVSACTKGDIDTVRFILQNNYCDLGRHDNMYVIKAAQNEQWHIVKILLSHTQVNPSDQYNTVFKCAYANKNRKILELLLNCRQFNNNESIYNFQELVKNDDYISTFHQHIETLIMQNYTLEYLAMEAASIGDINTLSKLSYMSNLNYFNCLEEGIKYNNLDTIKYILKLDLVINIPYPCGSFPPNVLKILLSHSSCFCSFINYNPHLMWRPNVVALIPKSIQFLNLLKENSILSNSIFNYCLAHCYFDLVEYIFYNCDIDVNKSWQFNKGFGKIPVDICNLILFKMDKTANNIFEFYPFCEDAAKGMLLNYLDH
jgi:hypothetical protein